MKRNLSHLPKHKREELKEIASIITENAEVEMIIWSAASEFRIVL